MDGVGKDMTLAFEKANHTDLTRVFALNFRIAKIEQVVSPGRRPSQVPDRPTPRMESALRSATKVADWALRKYRKRRCPPSPSASVCPWALASRWSARWGAGASVIVYRAFDRETQQWVALKLIAVQGVDASEEARFLREGKLLQELDHPHIVKLVACGTLEETPYVAMEWLEGEDLAARTRRNPLGLKHALDVARQIAVALDTAHRAGVIHRDIKPSNIFLIAHDDAPEEPIAKLVDFGVALEDDVRLTRTGVVVGTPAYMAPEQAKAEGVLDARADIYSLGATLFELVAGRPAHVGPTAIATLAHFSIVSEAPTTGLPACGSGSGNLDRASPARWRERWRE